MSVFSDQRIIDTLKDFVAVVQDTSLQNHTSDDELSKFFRSSISKAKFLSRQNITDFSFVGVKPTKHGVTTQGLYMFNAAGESYGGLNTNNDVDEVLRALAYAKKQFDESPPEKLDHIKYIASTLPTPPEGAVIARTFTRITPLPEGCSTLNNMVGRDHVWILRREIDALRRGEVPDSFAYRIARHHLVDNIRGEPGKWRHEHVKSLRMSAERREVGGSVYIVIRGAFSMLSPAGFGNDPGGNPLPERGYVGNIRGELEIGVADGEVRMFRMIGEGIHWGVSKNNAVAVPEGKYPLNVAFVLANDDLARSVPPHGMRRWRSNQEDYYGMALEDILGE